MPKTGNRNEQIAAFDTGTLLRMVDDLDVMCDHLKGDNFNAPEMQHDLLRLHGLATRFVNEGHKDPVMTEEMFDLAADLECRIQDLSDALARMLAPIRTLQALEPSDQARPGF
jgi:hypothetical protein